MIVLTRLNGARFAINDEQIERLEEAPNAIVVLVNGNRYTVLENLQQIIDTIVNFRAHVIDVASKVEPGAAPGRQPNLALVHSQQDPSPVADPSPFSGAPMPEVESNVDGSLPPYSPPAGDNPFRRPPEQKA